MVCYDTSTSPTTVIWNMMIVHATGNQLKSSVSLCTPKLVELLCTSLYDCVLGDTVDVHLLSFGEKSFFYVISK